MTAMRAPSKVVNLAPIAKQPPFWSMACTHLKDSFLTKIDNGPSLTNALNFSWPSILLVLNVHDDPTSVHFIQFFLLAGGNKIHHQFTWWTHGIHTRMLGIHCIWTNGSLLALCDLDTCGNIHITLWNIITN